MMRQHILPELAEMAGPATLAYRTLKVVGVAESRVAAKDAAEAVPALRQALEDRSADDATRVRSALALGNVGDAGVGALPALLAVLNDARSSSE